MITDAQRLAWLLQRVTYLEHKSKDGTLPRDAKVGGWWPVERLDHSEHYPDLEDLDLTSYIDAMIEIEGDDE